MVSPVPVKAPDRGDLIWINFTPNLGREQAGRRPAIVLSPISYNQKSGLVIACPITSRVKGYPFEVSLPEGLPVQGVILADHIKSIDWLARKAERVGTVEDSVLDEVFDRLTTLIHPGE